MAPDPRLHDNAYWQVRWAEAYKAFSELDAGGSKVLDAGNHIDVAEWARAVAAIESWNGGWSTLLRLVNEHDNNTMLYPVLGKQVGQVRIQLLECSLEALETTPYEKWPSESLNKKRESGLEPLPFELNAQGLLIWEQLRLDQTVLDTGVSLALFLLFTLDEPAFLRCLASLDHPLKLKAVSDRHADDGDLGLALADSSSPLVASLGVYHHLRYLEKVEGLGREVMRQLDPYHVDEQDLDAAAAIWQTVKLVALATIVPTD